MLWHAMPPEVNAAMLIGGAGPAPMMEAAAAWEQLSIALGTQATGFAGALAGLTAAWHGPGSDAATAASLPMLTWLQNAAQYAQQNALKAAAQAEAYVKAVGMTPSLPEIAANRITTGVLTATNFLGINTAPIGLNETDYFIRMWNQAGGAMDVYQAETALNTAFGPLESPPPIVKSAAAQLAAAQVEAAQFARSLVSQPAVTQVMGLAAEASDALATGDTTALAASLQTDAAGLQTGVGGAAAALTGSPISASTLTQVAPVAAYAAPSMLSQLVSQAGSMGSMGGAGGAGAGGAAAGVGDTTTLAGAGGTGPDGDKNDHKGLLGTSPSSTHPLAGGSGPSIGKGMMYSDALPGSGGSSARTSAMGDLLDKPSQGVTPAAASAGSSAAGGGAAPMGMMGAGAGAPTGTVSGVRQNEMVPAVHAQGDDDTLFDDGDDW
jgi:hypothetical protein